MKSVSAIQSELTRMRKIQKKNIENDDIDEFEKTAIIIHALEWVLDIQDDVCIK